MKVISLKQPWATLLALGEKKIETRSWSTKYRGEIYIHASKTVDKRACNEETCKKVLNLHGYNSENLPTGVIIAKCTIVDIRKTEDVRNVISEHELTFGDYSPNRYGWLLDEIEELDTPILAKGKLGLWEYKE